MAAMKAHVLVSVFAVLSALTIAPAPAHAQGAAGAELGPLLEGAFHYRKNRWASWEVDEAVIDAADSGTSEVRDRLVPVLVTAHAREAVGYDRLRDAVCEEHEAMSAERARACSTLPGWLEHGWRESDRTEQKVVAGVATVVYAGAITAAFVERNESAGRGIATAAGVPIGAATGITVFGVAVGPLIGSDHAKGGVHTTGDKILVASAVIGGAIAGGVAGGWLAHSLADSPGARAPVTAVALAPVYLTTVFVAMDWGW
jgi:hypothetical protein